MLLPIPGIEQAIKESVLRDFLFVPNQIRPLNRI